MYVERRQFILIFLNLSYFVLSISSEEIQDTLIVVGNNQIISYVNYLKENSAQCHFCSYPYTLRYYHYISNSFPGDLFKCVREVSLFDDRPFEHEFFMDCSSSSTDGKTIYDQSNTAKSKNKQQ